MKGYSKILKIPIKPLQNFLFVPDVDISDLTKIDFKKNNSCECFRMAGIVQPFY